ncbi:MAG: hypothetical protein ACXVB1_13560 [Pseudobdellovibrionaceae bacterium]
MMKVLICVCLFVTAFPQSLWATEADDLAYYQQFIYEQTEDNRDPENVTVSSRYLMSDFKATTPLPNGDSLNVIADIFLFKDFTFKVVYKENIIPKSSSGQFWPGACKVLAGTWSVKNGVLNLPAFGYLEKAQIQGQMAARMTVTEVIATSEGKGFQAITNYGFSNMTLDQAVRCFPF